MEVISEAVAANNNVVFDNQHPCHNDSRQELLQGLQQSTKAISPKFFYDENGSDLFDQITQLPEYYPSRTEMNILDTYREDIARCCGENCVIIEPGSGTSEKIRLLLDAINPSAYVPMDISEDFLFLAAQKLAGEYPWLKVHALCADFNHNWDLSKALPKGKRIVFYPGSTIGNLEPEEATRFLNRMHSWIGHDGGMLIGVDLHKSEDVLNAAYNDSQNITAAFNLNMLDHINPVLGANFDRQNFKHHAFYNQDKRRIEMHLISQREHQVECKNATISFKQGESIHTESSYKYTIESFTALAAQAELSVQHTWRDDDGLFSVHYLEPL